MNKMLENYILYYDFNDAKWQTLFLTRIDDKTKGYDILNQGEITEMDLSNTNFKFIKATKEKAIQMLAKPRDIAEIRTIQDNKIISYVKKDYANRVSDDIIFVKVFIHKDILDENKKFCVICGSKEHDTEYNYKDDRCECFKTYTKEEVKEILKQYNDCLYIRKEN